MTAAATQLFSPVGVLAKAAPTKSPLQEAAVLTQPTAAPLALPLEMASDEIVWQVINQQFCSFKLKFVAPRHSSQRKFADHTSQASHEEPEFLSQRVSNHRPPRLLPRCNNC